MIAPYIFYLFEAVAAISAISLIFIRNVFYGTLLLIVCLLALAGIFVLAFAEFIAVTQILVYAGGILVVILFGIMLTTKISGKPLVVEHNNKFAGTVTGITFFALLIYALSKESFIGAPSVTSEKNFNNLQVIGIGLMSDFVLPFEIAGVLLLIALVGASVVASSVKSKNT